jgi:hypothetical protein
MKTFISILTTPFKRNFTSYEGVRPIQIYLLRLVFILTFTFVGMDSWTAILTHEGEWKPLNAVAFSVWAAYSTLSVFGILKPLKMLPIIAFQIFYKTLWLMIVAYPLWIAGVLRESPVYELAFAFSWVILPIVAMPWSYFFRLFFTRSQSSAITSQIIIR